jgi:hypothetical protein
MCQRVLRSPFNHPESCQPLDGSFPIGAASKETYRFRRQSSTTLLPQGLVATPNAAAPFVTLLAMNGLTQFPHKAAEQDHAEYVHIINKVGFTLIYGNS